MIILHHGWRSSASRRVRLCLEEKGLAYEGHVVDMANMEHHSPEYLKINPLGVIPTMIHDGQPLHESGTICEYLDETFPDPPLRPDAPYQRAEMRNWIRHVDALIGNLIIFNWRHHLQKTASQWTDAELADKLKNIPSKERQEAWLRVARKPYTEEERDAARTRLVTQLLDKMEEALKPSGWMIGKAYSIADIAAVPFVKRLDEEIAPDEAKAASQAAALSTIVILARDVSIQLSANPANSVLREILKSTEISQKRNRVIATASLSPALLNQVTDGGDSSAQPATPNADQASK